MVREVGKVFEIYCCFCKQGPVLKSEKVSELLKLMKKVNRKNLTKKKILSTNNTGYRL